MKLPKVVLSILRGLFAVVVFVGVVCLLIIYVSGFLPSQKRAKEGLSRGHLRTIEELLREYIEEKGTLPSSLQDLVGEEGINESSLKDPFAEDWSNFRSQFGKKTVIVWSVGADGVDSMRFENSEPRWGDEIVLLCNTEEGRLHCGISGRAYADTLRDQPTD